MKQRAIILDYLDDLYPEWLPGYKLHGLSTVHGFIGSRGERTARDLRAEGVLESKMIGKFVHYRVKKELKQINIYDYSKNGLSAPI